MATGLIKLRLKQRSRREKRQPSRICTKVFWPEAGITRRDLLRLHRHFTSPSSSSGRSRHGDEAVSGGASDELKNPVRRRSEETPAPGCAPTDRIPRLSLSGAKLR